MAFKPGNIPWNIGLTKETDSRVREVSERMEGNQYGLDNRAFSGHHHTEKSKTAISEKLKGHPPSSGFSGHMHPKAWKEQARQWTLGNPANTGKTKETDEGMRRHAESMLGNRFTVGIKWTEERKEKFREMVSGQGNPAYIDGRSSVPYGPEFSEQLRKQIRERDGHTCWKCGHPEYLDQRLDVHHIDENPKNNLRQNLISLHKLCHLAIRKDRLFWRKFFQDLLSVRAVRDRELYVAQQELPKLRRRLVTVKT